MNSPSDSVTMLREALELAYATLGSRAVNQTIAVCSIRRQVKEALEAHLSASPAADGWLSIDDYPPHQPVLVSRPTDQEVYRPTTAFLDATGVWRVFRSEGGMTPLPFVPTHYMPTPAPPAKQTGEG